MKYGMNLLLWTGAMHDEMKPVLESLKKMGYDGVELPMFELDVDKWSKWGKILDEFGFERTGVTVRGEEDNPISPDASVRAKGIENNKLTLDCCQAAGRRRWSAPTTRPWGCSAGKAPLRTSSNGPSRACGRSPNTPRKPVSC